MEEAGMSPFINQKFGKKAKNQSSIFAPSPMQSNVDHQT